MVLSVDRNMMTARNIIPSSRICRNLFGPPDHEEVRKTLNRVNQILEERDRSAWNFNFHTGTPILGGRYEWQQISSASDEVPRAYELPHLNRGLNFSMSTADEAQATRTASPTVPSSVVVDNIRPFTPTGNDVTKVSSSQTTSHRKGKVCKRRQAKISDFFRTSKKSSKPLTKS